MAEDRYNRNKRFFQRFHEGVVRSGREGDEDGKKMTMKIGSLGIGDKTYLLPFYDPQLKKELTPAEVFKKYAPLVQAGKATEGYDSPEEAEADRQKFYPQIIAMQLLRNKAAKQDKTRVKVNTAGIQ